MRELANIKSFLKNYDGPDIKIMEVCGTHTAAIMHLGIPSMLSEHIRLISGPGCPVCVTVTAYIDKLVKLAMNPSNIIYAFGDLLRVMGSQKSLSMAKADGARVRMVYSPLDMLDAAEKDPEHTHIFAAVGFETTTPVYALLLEEAARRKIRNIKLLTSLKTMPAVIDRLCRANDTNGGSRITGFIAPGHVCAVSGYAAYRMLADKYRLPFVVSGFTGETLLASIYTLVKCAGEPLVRNYYPQVVREEGNIAAQEAVLRIFRPCDAAWRGLGVIAGSGMVLRKEYEYLDAGSENLIEDRTGTGCRCADVLTGKILPEECPMFGRACTPREPKGACMVSQEGSCFNHFTAAGIRS